MENMVNEIMEIENYLEKYCLTPAISGHEDRMIRMLSDDLMKLCDNVNVDNLGNVIAVITGKDSSAPALMIFAHSDQVGMIVRAITEDGYIRMERLGGVPERILAGAAVKIESRSGELISGIIGTTSHHLTPTDNKYVVQPMERCYIDIGARNYEEVIDSGINIGSPIAYEPRYTKILNSRISATSLDDRGGCAVLVSMAAKFAKKRPNATVYLVASVQEEFNLRGAMVAAQQINPKAAISIDLVVATDTPDLAGRNSIVLDGGPVLGTYTFHGRGTLNGLIPHPELVRLVESSAKNQNISLQRHATVGMLTDSSYVQLVGEGIPCVDVGWPARYTHSGVETSSLNDLIALEKLVCELVYTFPTNFDGSRLKEASR